jgi:hypothetical protein
VKAAPFLLAAAMALGCGTDRTAIVLEAVNEAQEPIEQVVFRVSGPGLDGGAREAAAQVAGPEARSFPLTLVLVGSDSTIAGPFEVTIDGRRSGQVVAQAVRIGGESPVAFIPGQVVHYRFALRSGGSPSSTPPDVPDPMTPPATPPPMMTPPATPPPMMQPPAVCTATDTCSQDHHCTCTPGCACQFTCAPEHCVVRCDGAGTTCEVDATGTKMANVDCSGGAACLVRGTAKKDDAHLTCAGDKPQECGEAAQACNRPCP